MAYSDKGKNEYVIESSLSPYFLKEIDNNLHKRLPDNYTIKIINNNLFIKW